MEDHRTQSDERRRNSRLGGYGAHEIAKEHRAGRAVGLATRYCAPPRDRAKVVGIFAARRVCW